MYDFVAIGDVTTDDFIHLEDERFQISEDTNGESKLSMPFRDKLPFSESVLVYGVGNAPNASVSAATLGLKSALVAHVGDDEHGGSTLLALKDRGVSTEFIRSEPGKKTNYSYVLWVKEDRTILRKHESFEYKLPEMGKPRWLYFSSVGEEANAFRDELTTYLESSPDIKFALQPGTNEINLGVKGLPRMYKRADIYFSNVEEAGKVLGVETLGIKELLKRMHEAGPKIVVITDGPRGAYAFDGQKTLFITPYPDPKPPLERTGAGDAFSSTTTAALALGKDLETALKWGAANSMSVVQHIGAQEGLLSPEQIEEYIKKAPKEFEIRTL